MNNSNNINKYSLLDLNSTSSIGEYKPRVVGINEWNNNAYKFNKKNINKSSSQYNTTYRLLNSYFNLDINKITFRSKRARLRFRRARLARNLFLSKPDIKHTNDTVRINIYSYDRSIHHMIRVLHLFQNKHKEEKLWNLHRRRIEILSNYLKHKEIDLKIENNIISKINKFKRDIKLNKSRRVLFYEKWVSNNYKFFLHRLSKINVFYILFNKYKWVVSLNTYLNIMNLYFVLLANNKKGKLKNYLYYWKIKSILMKNSSFKIQNIRTYDVDYLIKQISKLSENNKSCLNNINKYISVNDIYNLFKKEIIKNTFYDILKHKNRLFDKYLLRKYLFKNYLNNKYKYNNIINKLKLILSNIYNKKLQFNIIKLKYPHLHADVLINVISRKIRRKRKSLLKIMKFALNLTKLPSRYNQVNNNLLYNNSITNNSLIYIDKNSGKDLINTFVTQLYNNSTNVKHNVMHLDKLILSKKINDIISMLKYKWVSGTRIEISGRLTRRYTASRSVFKMKYKGSLKNVNYSKAELDRTNLSYDLLRGYNKSNVQYSFDKSKKRIGSFGIKGWISSY